MRLSWVQPEDLVGHELRQAEEEGKDVTAIAARWLAAGGSAPPERAGASAEPAPPALRRLAESLLDELSAVQGPCSADEPDSLRQTLPARLNGVADREALRERVHGAWLGRAAGCLLGKPVERIPREGIHEILEATGRRPLDGYFTGRGLPSGIASRWPWNRHGGASSLEENIDGMPEDDDLNFTMLALAVVERAGPAFTSEDVAGAWLDLLPAGRVFTAERVAYRNLLTGFEPPETATFRNPFREWIGARIRADAYGWIAAGDPARAAELARRDACISHAANGIYAAAFVAAACAAAVAGSAPTAAVETGLSVIPERSRLARAISHASELARGEPDWERVVDALYERHGELHWVHSINNTALAAAALVFFEDDFSSGICGVVSAGWDTDSNGAAVGSILGAAAGAGGIPQRWVAPLRNRIASSIPGFDALSFDELAERTVTAHEQLVALRS